MGLEWSRFAVKALRILNSDDNRGAALPRGELSRALCDAPDPATCPDPQAFAAFLDLLKLWAVRDDAAQRERVGFPARSLADVLIGIPGEARRQAERQKAMGGARFAAWLD